MSRVMTVGDEPIEGHKLLADVGGSAFYKLWTVSTPDGHKRQWKVIDLAVGNAAIETRTLGLLVKLRHPHLHTLTDFWQLDDGDTLILESEIPAGSLQDALERAESDGEVGLPADRLLDWFAQAADGLDFLVKPQHDFNGAKVAIYHRALRPECLLLFDGGKVCKVSDFGLSKPVTEETAQHSQGLQHYDYDPPEFFEGQTSPTSDLYALAINYYELRTGKRPFKGTMLEQLQARLSDSPDLSAVGAAEAAVLARALAREPKKRYATCGEFVAALATACEQPEAAPAPAARPEPVAVAVEETPAPRRAARVAAPPAEVAEPAPAAAAPPAQKPPSRTDTPDPNDVMAQLRGKPSRKRRGGSGTAPSRRRPRPEPAPAAKGTVPVAYVAGVFAVLSILGALAVFQFMS